MIVKDRVSNFKKLEDAKDVYELMKDLQDSAKEKFVGISLNARNTIICIEVVSIGTTTESLIDIKCALRTAILVNANSIVFAHNHPSGDSSPSSEDKNITMKIRNACELMDIRLLDHIIIGDNNYFSFLEHGLI